MRAREGRHRVRRPPPPPPPAQWRGEGSEVCVCARAHARVTYGLSVPIKPPFLGVNSGPGRDPVPSFGVSSKETPLSNSSKETPLQRRIRSTETPLRASAALAALCRRPCAAVAVTFCDPRRRRRRRRRRRGASRGGRTAATRRANRSYLTISLKSLTIALESLDRAQHGGDKACKMSSI